MASERKAVRTTTVAIVATIMTRSDPRTIWPMILTQAGSVPPLNPEAGSGSTRDGSFGSYLVPTAAKVRRRHWRLPATEQNGLHQESAKLCRRLPILAQP